MGIAQAGSTTRCQACGRSLDVPGTKQLRNLPPVPMEATAANRRQRDSATGGSGLLGRAIPAGLLALAAWGLSYGGYLAYLRWTAPIEFGHTHDELFADIYDRALQDPPARAWDHWQYIVDVGLPKQDPPLYFILSDAYERQWPWMIGALTVGALSLVAFLVSAVWQARRSPAR